MMMMMIMAVTTTIKKNGQTGILNTKLSVKNQITAFNTRAIPVLTYLFGIIKWTDTDLKGLDRLARRLLTNSFASIPTHC